MSRPAKCCVLTRMCKIPTLVPLEQALARADIFILGAPHSVYHSLSFPPDRQIVDVWNFWPKPKAASHKVEPELSPLKS